MITTSIMNTMSIMGTITTTIITSMPTTGKCAKSFGLPSS